MRLVSYTNQPHRINFIFLFYEPDLLVTTWFHISNQNPESVTVLSTKPLKLLITDSWCLHLYDATNNTISRLAGQVGPLYNADIKICTFFNLRNVILDTNHPNRIFVAEDSKIRVISDGVISTLIGDTHHRGYAEGMGPDALLAPPRGMALTANGESLIFCDTYNNALRAVNINTRQTSLVSIITYPRYCVWNRLTVKPKTELFITSYVKISRLDIATSKFLSRS